MRDIKFSTGSDIVDTDELVDMVRHHQHSDVGPFEKVESVDLHIGPNRITITDYETVTTDTLE